METEELRLRLDNVEKRIINLNIGLDMILKEMKIIETDRKEVKIKEK